MDLMLVTRLEGKPANGARPRRSRKRVWSDLSL